ncbi:MAG: CRISPR-associated helicase Cas3' [Deferribacteraceae bacterium]|nr:CRISPR-associated helicase Cas3' [Deferribacteraceae bacterium]
MKKILAKSDGTTLEEHTNALIACYDNWLVQIQKINPLLYDKIADWRSFVRDMLFFHDQGKRVAPFQQNLSDKSKQPVWHELLSLAFISEEKEDSWGDCAKYILNAIANHHKRDRGNPEIRKLHIEYLKDIYDDYKNNKPTDWDWLKSNGWDECIEKTVNCIFYDTDFFGKSNFDPFKHNFFKGMLHKCDYAASAGLKNMETIYSGNYNLAFQNYMSYKPLSPLQEKSGELSEKSVILIAPTGSGKTELSMNWVRKNGSCKVFYLLGMRTAVQKMYERWKDCFGDSNVKLLHGEIAYYMIGEEMGNEQYNNLHDKLTMVKQLSMPITIATADQIITSTLKYHSFETVYLTCAYSQIIVDEIQSFDPQAMAIIVYFLKEIHNLGGGFLLMTATLPPFIKKELSKLNNVELLDPLGYESHPKSLNMDLKRHRFNWLENSYINSNKTIAHIMDSFKEGKSVLAICNTVAIAQDVTQKLSKSGVEVNLLHARFIRKDRNDKEEQITKDAPSDREKSKPVIWVSTQIVEASLDIDFDEMHTEICTVDSLLQRFGRCYRKREYGGNVPNIFIYDYDKDGNPKNYTELVYDKELLEFTKKHIAEYDDRLLTEKDKYIFFNDVFSELTDTSEYKKKYNNMLTLLKNSYRAETRKEAQDLFRQSGMLNFSIVPFELQPEVDGLLENWANSSGKERVATQADIMQYTVSAAVKRNDIAKLRSLEKDYPNSKFAANLYYAPETLYKYDNITGLQYIKGDEPIILD